MLPIQSNFDVATAEGDTVLIPQRHFERLFDEDFGGGVLGIRAVCQDVAIYGACAPQTDDDNVYMPDWMMSMLREKSMKFDDELMVDVVAAGQIPPAHTIKVRRAEAEVEVNIHGLLQEFLYDCKYIQPNTVFHLRNDVDVVVESVIDEEGFEMEVGQLGAEVCLDIQDPVSAPEPSAPSAPVSEDPGPCPMIAADVERIPYAIPLGQNVPNAEHPIGFMIPGLVFVPAILQPATPVYNLEEVRRHRLAYYSSFAAVANVANGGGQETGAGNR